MALLTLEDLQLHLQQSTELSEFYQDAALAAIDDASGAVMGYLQLPDDTWTDQTCPSGVKLVAKRVAARLFSNPQQRTSYSGPEGLNFAGGPVRLLTDDEREQLGAYQPQHKRVGTIGLGIASWMRPS